jgi:FixJ family two-component response regulator
MKQTVFVIDNDLKTVNEISRVIKSIGLKIKTYKNGEEFLTAYNNHPGCLITEVQLKGMSGLRLQEVLLNRGNKIPIIFITAYGDIPMTVRAMKNGAVDFFTKPFNYQLLLDSVWQALRQNAMRLKELQEKKNIEIRLRRLSTRELE